MVGNVLIMYLNKIHCCTRLLKVYLNKNWNDKCLQIWMNHEIFIIRDGLSAMLGVGVSGMVGFDVWGTVVDYSINNSDSIIELKLGYIMNTLVSLWKYTSVKVESPRCPELPGLLSTQITMRVVCPRTTMIVPGLRSYFARFPVGVINKAWNL
jgi:hypothetical protein